MVNALEYLGLRVINGRTDDFPPKHTFHGGKTLSRLDYTAISVARMPFLAHFSIEYTTRSDHSYQHTYFSLKIATHQANVIIEGSIHTIDLKRLKWTNETIDLLQTKLKKTTVSKLEGPNKIQAWVKFTTELTTLMQSRQTKKKKRN